MLRFSAQPGRWERQLQRRHRNPLFGEPPPEVGRGELERARGRDQRESRAFREEIGHLFQQAVDLAPNVGSEVILDLKERLDKAYERAAALAGGEAAAKEGIRRLVEVIMQAVRRGAASDPQALEELVQEESARQIHYTLLEQPLVADLLAPDSPVGEEELVPTLLVTAPDALDAVLELFDAGQLAQLVRDGEALLTSRDLPPPVLADARQRLEHMRRRTGSAAPAQAH